MSDDLEPPRKTYQLRTEEKFERQNARPGEDDPAAANDVRAWRADQMAIEHEAGVDKLKPLEVPVINRRRRDFWTLFLTNNLVFGTAAYFGQDNPMMFASGLAGIFLGSIGCYWILYHIMGKY
jgi:hypothetical protein